jgi:hypothetical protein
MVSFNPKPHISPAIARLRHGVTFSALVLALCAAVQMLVFGFTHFTTVRWEDAKVQPAPLAVVAPHAIAAVRAEPAPAVAPTPTPAPKADVKPPRVLSDADATLHTVSDLAVTGGVMATFCLAIFCLLGTVVAAGQGTPGVEQASSATMWATLIGLAALPWHDVMASVPWGGVFGPYGEMASMSDAVDAGKGAVLTLHVHFMLMPLAVLAGAMVVLFRFRSGVAQGVIVTSVNELDERLERELTTIRSKGVETGAARSVGALNRAIGDVPAPIQAAIPEPVAVPAAAAKRSGLSWLHRERRIGESDPGDGLKRPI